MGKQRPTREGAQKLEGILRSMQERQERESREATAFKPGELTSEEEKFVKENNLNALNYIPQRTIQRQAEMFASPKRPQNETSASSLRIALTGSVMAYSCCLSFSSLGVSLTPTVGPSASSVAFSCSQS
jgi:hypothetical protein